ncbi:hypothetical protein [Sphingomonas sp.]|jgi:hypothetical protein|uniref:hypothetical protein n=1 Tax=Sphingomonas sp. TaxID=28214 RepID=UPI002ED95697
MVWVLVVALYFLWEADRYRGLYAFLAEWQFEQLGHYFPILTFAVLVIGFGSPAAWLMKKRRRADRRDIPDRYGYAAAVSTSMNFRRSLFAFAGGLGGAALVTLLWTLTLPRMAPPRALIPVGGARAVNPPLGPVTLRGQILFKRTSVFAQNVVLTARGVRFAPIVAPGDGNRIRFFVELLPREFGDPRAALRLDDRTGLLMRNQLPGSIVRLYRYAGYEVEAPVYILYVSSKTLRWPYYVTAAQLAIAALVAAIAGLLQHRHVRSIASSPPGTDPLTPE